MPIDVPRFWDQVRLGEDTALELKEVDLRGPRLHAPRRDDLADELAAFANSQGGRLVLGVTDDRQPQSLDPDQLDALARVVTEICTDSIKPQLVLSVNPV
ncbi:MAG: ATP-binding protein, partial [Acidobacteriota bacterium]|nr:ATP-binding protein [Acidobacteriota bacterium]